jgi:cobalt-zinc-cadmium efflux system outer membrane protein
MPLSLLQIVVSFCAVWVLLVQPDPAEAQQPAELGLEEALTPATAQSQEVWTLERSIRRVLEIAPEVQAARAEVTGRQGALSQAGVWPNPEFALRGDDKIGKDAGTGGVDVTQFVLNQPLPLSGRLGAQRDVAGAELRRAQAERLYQNLVLEVQVSQRFHALQLAAANLRLAEQRLQLAHELQQTGRRREQAGDIARLERLRLDLIRESAQQILDQAEGKFNEALNQFRAYLGLSAEAALELVSLEPFSPVPVLDTLQAKLSEHPALRSANARLSAARAGVDVVRKERLPDPVLSLYRERDFLNGRRQDVNGIGLAITVPLWDRKSGRLREARAQVDQALSRIQALERDLASGLTQRYLHLTHVVKRGEHYRSRVFEPAQTVFELTRKAYAAGEVEILALIDANNTYFDVHERYVELLQEAWLEAAELRLAAGSSFVATTEDTHHE